MVGWQPIHLGSNPSWSIHKMIKELRPKIKEYFTEAAHTFDHTERVYKLAVRIAEDEGADLEVIKAAALLHDIGRPKEDPDKDICHAEESAKMAPDILREINFPEEKIENVVHAISVHRYSKQLKAETEEAEIIQDADRLDAIGAINIGRTFSRGGEKGRPLHDPSIEPNKEYTNKVKAHSSMAHFYEKILKIKPETFKTKLAKEIAKERYAFTEEFIERFEKEWRGEL